MVAIPRPTTSEARTIRAAVLADLVSVYPSGMATADLLATHGTCAKSRIHELELDGYDVRTCDVEGRPGYRLASLTRGRKTQTLAGCTLRLTDDPAEPWTKRTHHEARVGKVVPLDVLQEAESAASEAYRGVLVQRGFGHLLGPTVQKLDGPEAEPDPYVLFGADQEAEDQDDDGYDEAEDLAAYRAWHDDDRDDDDEED